jgi:hypothetical protein
MNTPTFVPPLPVKGYFCTDDGFVDCAECHVDYPGHDYSPIRDGEWAPYGGYYCHLCGAKIV